MYRKKSSGSNTYIRQNDFKTKAIKKRHRRTLHNTQVKNPSEDINIINIYAPNIGAPEYIQQILEDFKKDTDSNTLVVGDFNTPWSTMDGSSKQRINKDILALNNTLDHMNLIDIYRTFHPKESKHMFFSTAHGTFSKADHIVSHKTRLKKLKKIKIMLNILSDHNDFKLQIGLKEKTQKHSNS